MDQGAKKFILWNDVIAECIERLWRGKAGLCFLPVSRIDLHYLIESEAIFT